MPFIVSSPMLGSEEHASGLASPFAAAYLPARRHGLEAQVLDTDLVALLVFVHGERRAMVVVPRSLATPAVKAALWDAALAQRAPLTLVAAG